MMIYSTYIWNLVQALESATPVSCKTPATSIDSICPNNDPRKNKKFWKRIYSQQIAWFCLGLRTQNPVLKEVDLEPTPKRRSNKINRLRPRRNNKDQEETTQQKSSCIMQSELTNENPALREVDLEPTAERGTNRTEALMSLYLLSQSLPLKQSINRNWYKSTLIDPIKWSRTSKEINQIPKLHAVQHIKSNFLKVTNSINAHNWDYKWSRHTQI